MEVQFRSYHDFNLEKTLLKSSPAMRSQHNGLNAESNSFRERRNEGLHNYKIPILPDTGICRFLFLQKFCRTFAKILLNDFTKIFLCKTVLQKKCTKIAKICW